MTTPPPPNSTSSTPTAGGADVPLRIEELLERCVGNTSIAVLLLGKFERQMHDTVREIETLLGAGDANQVSRTAHALTGAAGTVGAVDVYHAAAALELIARENSVAGMTQRAATLRSEIDRCTAYLPTARASLSTPKA